MKHVVLVGFMGTGKSTIGRGVAKKLGCEFWDVDHEIESRAHQTISQIFQDQGEAVFRKWESDVLVDLLNQPKASVIAAGGGALLNPLNRERIEHLGIMVCLSASLETLQERLKRSTHRPLLQAADRDDRLKKLYHERAALYASCPDQVITDGKSIQQSVDEVAQLCRDKGFA